VLKKKKICFISSSGGHFEQLMMLTPLINKYDSYVVTENTNYKLDIKTRIYKFNQINRKDRFLPFELVKNAFNSLKVFLKERPSVVITTGVLFAIPTCLICKFFGAKLIYIESFAKIDSPTKTGKFLYKYSDLFIVQWEDLLTFYPNAIFLGGIY
jgi:UDP-N-acetylglucosamine:LPS N-acetylglucosamine transferase